MYSSWEEKRIFDSLYETEEYEVHNDIEGNIDVYSAVAYTMVEDHTAIDTENDFFQTVAPAPESEGTLDYWTPEDEEIVTEFTKNDILDQLDYLHHTETSSSRSPQQRQASYEHFMDQLSEAQTLKELSAVQAKLRKAVTNSLVMTDGGEEVPTLFPKGHIALFWKYYYERKDSLVEEQYGKELRKIKSLLKQYTDVSDLKALKSVIYNEKALPFPIKKTLQTACQNKINTLASA
jgi:hypothetical protein